MSEYQRLNYLTYVKSTLPEIINVSNKIGKNLYVVSVQTIAKVSQAFFNDILSDQNEYTQ